MTVRPVPVSLGDRSYVVHVTDQVSAPFAGLATALGRPRVVVVTDDVVGPLWLGPLADALRADGVRVDALPSIAGGESHKTEATWWSIVDGLLTAGVDRRTPVVALGGGVVGDLVGFAAATALRGLPFVQVPTTLLAMVDSSVGGKTGFNHPRGKNLIGAFHQPALVWASLATLGTLPPRELRCGLAEAVKTALLGDAPLLDWMEQHVDALAAGAPDALAEVVARCVAVKARVVAADERETGERATLNAGHTVGHAVEAVGGYGRWQHGEAVAIGLVAEARWALRAGICVDPTLPDRLAALLGRLGLDTTLPQLGHDALIAAMGLDKKRDGATLVVPVPVRPGELALVPLPVSRASELLS